MLLVRRGGPSQLPCRTRGPSRMPCFDAAHRPGSGPSTQVAGRNRPPPRFSFSGYADDLRILLASPFLRFGP
eukprot:1026104-Pyramimonas_sp.AAC.1